MAKERIMAIIIGLIMVLSAAGFALNSAVNQQNRVTTPKITVPTIVTEQLTTDEIVYVLQNGKVIIEFLYAGNCTECPGKISTLEGFANKMSDFVVLEEVPANDTSIQIIGSGGEIKDISNMTLSDQNIMNTFCSVAIAQPPECLMGE